MQLHPDDYLRVQVDPQNTVSGIPVMHPRYTLLLHTGINASYEIVSESLGAHSLRPTHIFSILL